MYVSPDGGNTWLPWNGSGGPGGAGGGTSALSSVAASASSVTLLAANASRYSFIFYNDSTSKVFVKFGITASSSSYTVRLSPTGTLTSRDLGVNYTGRIDAIWDSAVGTMLVTEITA